MSGWLDRCEFFEIGLYMYNIWMHSFLALHDKNYIEMTLVLFNLDFRSTSIYIIYLSTHNQRKGTILDHC